MSDKTATPTPRTDAIVQKHFVKIGEFTPAGEIASVCRELERELSTHIAVVHQEVWEAKKQLEKVLQEEIGYHEEQVEVWSDGDDEVTVQTFADDETKEIIKRHRDMSDKYFVILTNLRAALSLRSEATAVSPYDKAVAALAATVIPKWATWCALSHDTRSGASLYYGDGEPKKTERNPFGELHDWTSTGRLGSYKGILREVENLPNWHISLRFLVSGRVVHEATENKGGDDAGKDQ